MRADWAGTYSRDQKRDLSFVAWPTLSWAELAAARRIAERWEQLRYYYPGQLALGSDDLVYVCLVKTILIDPTTVSSFWTDAVEADYELPAAVDYTDILESGSHSSQEMGFTLVPPSESTVLPGPGDIVGLIDTASDQILFSAQVDSIDSRSLSRGSRLVTGTARSRDAGPLWRAARWTSDIYPVGTELAVMATDLLRSMRLTAEEYSDVHPTARWTPHTNTQLGDLTAWEMLSTIYLPVLQEPFVDARGRFKPISRDVRRDADFVLEEADVLSRNGPTAAAPTTSVLLKWLDYRLTKSKQQSQALGQGQVTAGFFARYQHVRIYWSKDRKQRAENTFMKVIQTANQAEINFCEESYEQVDPFHGRVTVETDEAAPAILVAAIASAIAGLAIGDEVTAVIVGWTVRIGSLITDVAILGIIAVMRQVGTGTYEVWGQPYDYVHAVNRTEVYIRGARPWEVVQEQIESDFVNDENHAQQVAGAELLYRHLGKSGASVEIVDRPAVERGDILLLPGDFRFYVRDYRRDFRRGAPAVLSLEGFRV